LAIIEFLKNIVNRLFRLDYRSQRQIYWNGLTLVTIVTFVIGYWGYYVYDASFGAEVVWADNLSDTLRLLRGHVNEKHLAQAVELGQVHSLPWQLRASRVILPIFSFSFIVMVFVSLLGRSFKEYLVRFKKGHVIVVGKSDEALAMMDNLVKNGYQVVAVWSKEDLNWGGDPDLVEQGVIFIGGRPSSENTLLRAGVRFAQSIITIEESSSGNLETIILACAVSERRRPKQLPPLQGVSQISDFSFHQQFSTMGLPSLHSKSFNHRVFSQPSVVSQQAWQDNSWYYQYLLDNSSCFHAVIFGFGSVGQDLALRIARQCYFPGISQRRITVIDTKSSELGERFLSQVPWFSQCCDINFVEFDAKGLTPGFFRELFLTHLTPPAHNFYVCFDQDDLSLQCFQGLLHSMRNTEYTAASLYIRLSGRKNLAALFESFEYSRWYDPNIQIFGEVSALYGIDYLIMGTQDALASQIHDYYRKTYGSDFGNWEELPEVFKESNRQQADHIRQKLISVGCGMDQGTCSERFQFSKNEVGNLAVVEHERWLAERLSSGWKYGKTRSDSLFLHPSMVPYNELSAEEKSKDANAVEIIPEIVSDIGIRIFRERRISVLPLKKFAADAFKNIIVKDIKPGEKLVLFTSLTTAPEIELSHSLLNEIEFDLYITRPYVVDGGTIYLEALQEEDIRLKELFSKAKRVLKVAIGHPVAELNPADCVLSAQAYEEMQNRLRDQLACDSIWDEISKGQ